MASLKNKTAYQVQSLGFMALQKELGISGLIQFMKQFDLGSGNYTMDRDAWQHNFSLPNIVKAIKKQRKATS